MTSDLLSFYCDSSSHRGHKFLVAGGVAVKANRVGEINDQIQSLKDNIGMRGEFKWSGYSGGRKQATYEALVQLFFGLLEEGKLHFHVLVCDFDEYNHHLKGRGSPEKSVNKLYYQLMLHQICNRYGKTCRIEMFPDHGNDSSEVVRFREMICAGAYKFYNTKPNCLRAIKPTPSANHNVLQMVDVIIGSIAAARERRRLAAHKAALSDHILASAPVSSWDNDVDFNANRLTLWNFKVNK